MRLFISHPVTNPGQKRIISQEYPPGYAEYVSGFLPDTVRPLTPGSAYPYVHVHIIYTLSHCIVVGAV